MLDGRRFTVKSFTIIFLTSRCIQLGRYNSIAIFTNYIDLLIFIVFDYDLRDDYRFNALIPTMHTVKCFTKP